MAIGHDGLTLSPDSQFEGFNPMKAAACSGSRHLRVLRSTGLIADEPNPDDARVRIYSLQVEPIDDLTSWLSVLSSHWRTQLQSFTHYAEQQDSETK